MILMNVKMLDESKRGRKRAQGLTGSGEQLKFFLASIIAQFSDEARFQAADEAATVRPGHHGDAPTCWVVPRLRRKKGMPRSQFMDMARVLRREGTTAAVFGTGALNFAGSRRIPAARGREREFALGGSM